jgi:superfamily II DNA/RNA helicase
VNFDVARDIDTHTHRIGRTGRFNETMNLKDTCHKQHYVYDAEYGLVVLFLFNLYFS